MRIITGTARGATLATLDGDATRPTAERVKEAVFSSIQFQLEGTRFLDLFAGSGQMGLEAVSRGANLAVFVDASSDAIEIIKANAKKTHLFESCRIVNYRYSDYLRGFSKSGEPAFDYIYIDPPFTEKIHGEVLKKLAESGAADTHTLIMAECDSPDQIFSDSDTAEKYEIVKLSRYGRIHIVWLQLKPKAEV